MAIAIRGCGVKLHEEFSLVVNSGVGAVLCLLRRMHGVHVGVAELADALA